MRRLRDHILEQLRRSDQVFTDATTEPALEPGRKKTKSGRFWTYACGNRPWSGSDPLMTAYVYAAGDNTERLKCTSRALQDLQVEGYGAYAALTGAIS